MARIDKTESAVGVQRVEAGWAADAASSGELDVPLGVGIDSTGKAVVGAGQTGIVGVSVRSKVFRRAGDLAEYLSLGEIVDVTGLDAGKKVYAVAATGVLTHAADTGGGSPVNNTLVGYTIEADRLVVRL